MTKKEEEEKSHEIYIHVQLNKRSE